jgi:hypothetical protein
MTQTKTRVGIVGANARKSWANLSHAPAINSLPGLKLATVATRNEQSALEAAGAFGADRWYSDPFATIGDKRIDVITVAVKVPAHRELVLAALEAGKAVYCEAPLGCTVAETEEMASSRRSLHTAIGLQGRLGAAINVGEVHAHLVRDLHAGTYNTPGFEHALHFAHLIDAVTRAAERGERQKVRDQIESLDETRAIRIHS